MTTLALVVLLGLAALGRYYWLVDVGRRPQIKRFIGSMLFVLLLARAVVYAAEVQIYGCADYEKYSLWWYLNGCMFGEHSS